MFGIPGLRFTCPLVWTYVLVIPVIISFVLSTFSIYISQRQDVFLGICYLDICSCNSF